MRRFVVARRVPGFASANRARSNSQIPDEMRLRIGLLPCVCSTTAFSFQFVSGSAQPKLSLAQQPSLQWRSSTCETARRFVQRASSNRSSRTHCGILTQRNLVSRANSSSGSSALSMALQLPAAVAGDAAFAKGFLAALVLCLPGYKPNHGTEYFVTYGTWVGLCYSHLSS